MQSEKIFQTYILCSRCGHSRVLAVKFFLCWFVLAPRPAFQQASGRVLGGKRNMQKEETQKRENEERKRCDGDSTLASAPCFGGGRPPLYHPHSLAKVRLHPTLSALVCPCSRPAMGRALGRWGVGVSGDGPGTGQLKDEKKRYKVLNREEKHKEAQKPQKNRKREK